MIPIPPSLASIGIPNIPKCHAMMYAEWVKRGRPSMEYRIPRMFPEWTDVVGDPEWGSNNEYRFKAEKPADEIPECHSAMYAEWVKRGKPPLEHITDLSLGWEPVYGEPVWTKSIRYRFKDSLLDERSKAPRHLLDEMPIANFEDSKPHSVEQKSALQSQIGGDHYAKLKIQPVEYIHANGLSFIEGCVVKYVTRHKAKNGKQDLEKARHFLDMLIELEYPDAD